MKSNNLKKSAIALIAISLVCKLIGMLRDIVLAYYFGTSSVTDAYMIAASVPTAVFYFVGNSISTAFLPMYNQIRRRNGEGKALDYTNNLTCISLIVVSVLVAALLIFTGPILKLFAPGFDADTMALTIRLVRICAASLFFMTIISIWTGYLQAHSNFAAPGAVSLARNTMIIASVVIAANIGAHFLGVGLLLAYVAECVLLLPFVIRAKFRPKLAARFREKEVSETLFLVLPILLGVGVGQINKIIDRSIASTISDGGVSALSYASIINLAIETILVSGVISILFAHCAELAAQGQHKKVKNRLSATVDMLSFLLLPTTAGVIVLAREIVTTIFSRGSFDAASVTMTTGALRFYSCGIVFLAVRDSLVKLFYAYKDTKTTTITSVISIGINIGLNLLLSRWFGINGLAASTSIAAAIHCISLYFILRKRIGDFGLKKSLNSISKSVLASLIMAALLQILRRFGAFLGLPAIVSLGLLVIIGMLCYMLVTLLLKTQPLLDILQMLKRKKRTAETGVAKTETTERGRNADMLTAQNEGLRLLVRSAILQKPEKLPEGFSLAKARATINSQQITSIALEGAVQCGISQTDPAMSALIERSCVLYAYSSRQMNEIEALCRTFEAERIDYLLLKGINLKALYAEPHLREMSDADILIRMEQYDKIRPIMKACGFARGQESDHELHWEKAGLHVELHKRLIPSNNKRFSAYYEDIWQRVRPVSEASTRYEMTKEDELIFYVSHFAKHYRDGGIGTKHLTDLWYFLRANPSLDSDYLNVELEKLSLLQFYENLKQTAEVWFGNQEQTPATETISRVILTSGAYGSGRSQYIAAAAHYSTAAGSAKIGRRKRIFYLFFPPYKAMCRLYPAVKTVPILLPFMWVWRWISTLLFRRKKVKTRYQETRTVTPEVIEAYQKQLETVGLCFDEKNTE